VPDLGALAEDFLVWCDAFGVRLFGWQRDAFGEATRREGGRFVHALAGISVPRGNGKSYAAAAAGAWRLTCGPQPQLVLSVALDYEGAKVVLDHAGAIFRSHADLAAAVEIRADSIVVPSTGGRWLVRSREHASSRGLHPDLVVYDECGWARDDELFSSLLASQASVLDPLMLVVSTVGRLRTGPLWRIKELAEQELAETGGLR
jgi:phage terminase large subunit-like protein